MPCNCGKRQKLIGAAIKAVKTGKPVAPIVRGFGRTVVVDAKMIGRVLKPGAAR